MRGFKETHHTYKMKIAVLTLALGTTYKNIVKYGVRTKAEYCKMHSYDFITEEGNEDCIDPTRPFAWSKLKLIQKYMGVRPTEPHIRSEYDLLVWIDADTFIMNPNIKLQDIYERYVPANKDMMIVSDWKIPNTGVIFIRPTQFVYDFITAIYSVPNYTDFTDYEQGVFLHLHKENVMKCQEKVLILPVNFQRICNSYWFNYYPGDFILHFPGCRVDNLGRTMDKYCPVKRDDEMYDVYYNRVSWIFNRSRTDSDKTLKEIKQKEKEKDEKDARKKNEYAFQQKAYDTFKAMYDVYCETYSRNKSEASQSAQEYIQKRGFSEGQNEGAPLYVMNWRNFLESKKHLDIDERMKALMEHELQEHSEAVSKAKEAL
jgi:galactosyl transferase GMA12/MNN10 family.